MQQPWDLSFGKALDGAKGTSLKDRDDVKRTGTGGMYLGLSRALGCDALARGCAAAQGREMSWRLLRWWEGRNDAGKERIAPNPDIFVSPGSFPA